MIKLKILYFFILAMITISAVAEDHGQTTANKLPAPIIAPSHNLSTHSVPVLDATMSHLEIGEGEPIIFIHGNPTSSYLWRNIMPLVADKGRAIAVDLIGMGNSGKPDLDYSFADHYRYFSAFISTLNAKKVTLVGHDWGAALAWEYARNHPQQVKQLAFMEGVLPPTLPFASFEAMGPEMGNMFKAFKDPIKGQELVIDNNMFVEQILPGFVNRPLDEEAMNQYRAPHTELVSRKPLLAWPREIPIGGEPKTTSKAMEDIRDFMGVTKMPVLLLYASPGVLITPQDVPWYEQQIHQLETAFIGQGLHFIQEDQPEAIGRALNDWIRRH